MNQYFNSALADSLVSVSKCYWFAFCRHFVDVNLELPLIWTEPVQTIPTQMFELTLSCRSLLEILVSTRAFECGRTFNEGLERASALDAETQTRLNYRSMELLLTLLPGRVALVRSRSIRKSLKNWFYLAGEMSRSNGSGFNYNIRNAIPFNAPSTPLNRSLGYWSDIQVCW